MPLVGLVLLASVLPLQFALLKLSTRDGNDAAGQLLESLKRCLGLRCLWGVQVGKIAATCKPVHAA
jgi:hypothetical protein